MDIERKTVLLLGGSGLVGLAALLIYLPMGSYLLTHPALFGARALSVTVWHFLDTPTGIAAELGRNLLRVAGFFCCQGSPNPYHPITDNV